MNTRQDKMEAFGRLLDIMDDLREKCPWDRKQTMESLRNLTIEETYELADAIHASDLNGVREELGDLMLHMIFYSKIGEEQGAFDMADVLHAQCDKLIHRHPHIYGDVVVSSEEDVKRNWEQLKLKEGKVSVLQGVPVSLPALIKAYRIQDKAGQVNFQWENTLQVWEKVLEELGELKEHLDASAPVQADIEDEFGDLLFALVNLSRYIGVDPENALERTNKKFIRRFSYIEKQAIQSGKQLTDMSLAEMDQLWNEAKLME
jgi:XTP/dITP diphosphohydrolase